MDAQRIWTLTGIFLGVAAGVLGAYAGWKSSRGPLSKGPARALAVFTLLIAIGLGAVALKVKVTWGIRTFLLLPSAFLGYWFARQTRTITRHGRPPGRDEGGRHRL
jgi:hypothetical protein